MQTFYCIILCRLSREDGLVPIETLNNADFIEMWKKYMTQVNLSFTKHSKVCSHCKDEIQCYFKFVSEVGLVEEKINTCRQTLGKENKSIDITKTLKYLFNDVLGRPSELTQTCKTEEESDNELSGRITSRSMSSLLNEPDIKEEADIFLDEYYLGQPENDNVLNEHNYCAVKKEQSETEIEDSRLKMEDELDIKEDTDYQECFPSATRLESISDNDCLEVDTKSMCNLDPRIPIEEEAYKCPKCKYHTNIKQYLEIHMTVHKDKLERTVYKCPLCAHKTYWKNNLPKHIEIWHSSVQSKTSTGTIQTEHQETASNSYHLEVNPNTYNLNPTGLTGEKLYKSKRAIYKCGLCNYKTYLKSILSLHFQRKHSPAPQLYVHDTSTSIEVHKCTVCGYKTKWKDALVHHQLKHKNMSESQGCRCPQCPYWTLQKGSLMSHLSKHKKEAEVRMYNCSFCGYKTKYRSNVRRHISLHSDVKAVEMYRCSVCGNDKLPSAIHGNHMWQKPLPGIVITEDKTCTCGNCPKSSEHHRAMSLETLAENDTENLPTRIRTLNSEIPMDAELHKCDVCGYQTNIEQYLKRHMLTHRDKSERTIYKCEECVKKQSQINRYGCSVCPYRTNNKCHLKNHVIVHATVKMYECTVCAYKGKRKGDLEKHQLKHKDKSELPVFKCSQCPYTTYKKTCLSSHFLKHKKETEVEMFNCSFCSFKSKYRSNMRRHMTMCEYLESIAYGGNGGGGDEETFGLQSITKQLKDVK